MNDWEGEGAEDGLRVDEVPATVLDSQPGDAVMFDFRLWVSDASAFRAHIRTSR